MDYVNLLVIKINECTVDRNAKFCRFFCYHDFSQDQSPSDPRVFNPPKTSPKDETPERQILRIRKTPENFRALVFLELG